MRRSKHFGWSAIVGSGMPAMKSIFYRPTATFRRRLGDMVRNWRAYRQRQALTTRARIPGRSQRQVELHGPAERLVQVKIPFTEILDGLSASADLESGQPK